MGNCMTCERAGTCGTCPWGQECFSCVYGDQEGHHAPDTTCHFSATSVSLQIILPAVILLLLLLIALMTGRWKRLKRIRAQQVEGFNIDLARLEGIYAANAVSYSFSKDIFPYIVPTDIRACMLYYPLPSKFFCTTGIIFKLLGAIFLLLGLFTIQSGYNDYILKNTHHLATAGVVLGVLGCIFCCVFCVLQMVMKRSRQELNNEREQHVLRAAAEAGINVIPAAAVAISVSEPMPQQPQMFVQQQMQPPPQYQYTPQLPMSQQPPQGYAMPAINPYAPVPIAQSPAVPVTSSSTSHTDYVPLH